MVLDASVMIAWLINEPHLALGDDIYQLLAERTIHVPAHWPAEIANAMAVNIRKGRIRLADFAAIDQRLCKLDVIVEPAPTLERIKLLVQFATEYRLTAYDAAYVLLAHNSGVTLATIDGEMRKAAQQLSIPLLPTAAP